LDWIPILGLWKIRGLVLQFSILNIKLRYRDTKLGIIWSIIEPILFFTFIYIVFTNLRDYATEDFAIYLLAGIVLYHSFSRSSIAGLGSVRQNYLILSSININKEFFPVTAAITSGILLAIEIGVFFGLMLFFNFIPSYTIFLFPIVAVLLWLLILGISYILSIVNVYFSDIQPFWGIMTTVLFFISPIFWRLDDAGGIVLEIHKINPLGHIIELSHKIVFGEIPPFTEWLYASIFVLSLVMGGFLLFKKFEKNILENI